MNSPFIHVKESEAIHGSLLQTSSTGPSNGQSNVRGFSAPSHINLCKRCRDKQQNVDGGRVSAHDFEGTDEPCFSRSSSWPSYAKEKMRSASGQNRDFAKHSLAREFVSSCSPSVLDRKQQNKQEVDVAHQGGYLLRQNTGCFANHGRKRYQDSNTISSHRDHVRFGRTPVTQLCPGTGRIVEVSGRRRTFNAFSGCAACISYQDERPDVSFFSVKEIGNDGTRWMANDCPSEDIERSSRYFRKHGIFFGSSVGDRWERNRAENRNPNQVLNANNLDQHLRYVRTPPELSKRIFVLEKKVVHSKKIGNCGSSHPICSLSVEAVKSNLEHESPWLPNGNVIYELGYPKQDNDIHEYFVDCQGLSARSVDVLKTELLRHLHETRDKVETSAIEMQLILLRQSRFRVVSDDEIMESVAFVVQSFISARIQMVEKFRVYVRTWRWIENINNRRRKGFLSNRQNNILRLWLFSNFHDPYPSSEDKKKLTFETKLDMNQINNWLINARSRIWKPTVERICTEGKRKLILSSISSGSEQKRRRISLERCQTQAQGAQKLSVSRPHRSIPQEGKQSP